jgi:transcriptional regulator with XRE-family HTH domain
VPNPSGRINERERAICKRVHLFREKIKWPLYAVAEQIGISKNKLAGIEYERTPLKYRIGIEICRIFDVSGEWLVSGKGEMHGAPPLLLAVVFDDFPKANQLFSEAYDESPELFAPPETHFQPNLGPTPGFDSEAFLLKEISIFFKTIKFRTPHHAEQISRAVLSFLENSRAHYMSAGLATRVKTGKVAAGSTKKPHLTDVYALVNNETVKHEMPSLLGRLKSATSKRGKKSELAEYLGVQLAAVSQWLSSKREPGGEITLKLLHWVEQQERQK